MAFQVCARIIDPMLARDSNKTKSNGSTQNQAAVHVLKSRI